MIASGPQTDWGACARLTSLASTGGSRGQTTADIAWAQLSGDDQADSSTFAGQFYETDFSAGGASSTELLARPACGLGQRRLTHRIQSFASNSTPIYRCSPDTLQSCRPSGRRELWRRARWSQPKIGGGAAKRACRATE